MSNSRSRRAWTLSLIVLIVVTAGLHPFRSHLQQAHTVLVYLLIVLVGSAYGGRLLGLVLAVLGFLAIDYFFQVPFDLLSVGNRLDLFVLLAFVITAFIAADLLARAQEATARAQHHTDEVARLSRLGAELLGTGTAESALAAIADKVREAAQAERCVVFRAVLTDAKVDLETLLVRGHGATVDKSDAIFVIERNEPLALSASDSVLHPMTHESLQSQQRMGEGFSVLMLPLRVHDRSVGVLGVASDHNLHLDDGSRRLLDALSYYAAIAIERVTLVAKAEHAEALRESIRVREALLASVSHDLRTPLSTIKLLAQDSVSSGDITVASANANIIEEEADRLSGIVNNLLDLTRLRSSAFPVHPEINAAEDLVGAVARQVRGILDDHALDRRIDQAGPVLLGRFDFVQSQRILVNLIENAVRHSPPGAPVVLVAGRDENSLTFSVTDSGPGVPPGERERIFEPFYRIPAAVADVGGVGLGLYIARALAEVQGGTLTYIPRAEGGSTFVLRLPSIAGATIDAEMLEDGI